MWVIRVPDRERFLEETEPFEAVSCLFNPLSDVDLDSIEELSNATPDAAMASFAFCFPSCIEDPGEAPTTFSVGFDPLSAGSRVGRNAPACAVPFEIVSVCGNGVGCV